MYAAPVRYACMASPELANAQDRPWEEPLLPHSLAVARLPPYRGHPSVATRAVGTTKPAGPLSRGVLGDEGVFHPPVPCKPSILQKNKAQDLTPVPRGEWATSTGFPPHR